MLYACDDATNNVMLTCDKYSIGIPSRFLLPFLGKTIIVNGCKANRYKGTDMHNYCDNIFGIS